MKEPFFVIDNVHLIDGTGQPPLDDCRVVVQGNSIQAVGPGEALDIPPLAEIIDGRGLTLLPGLMDSHLHLQGTRSMNPLDLVTEPPELRAVRSVMDLWRIIDHGFTTIRDCGENNALYLKRAVSEGKIIGPRILACGGDHHPDGGGTGTRPIPCLWSGSNNVA